MTMITPSYLGETIEYSSLHACRSTLEDPTVVNQTVFVCLTYSLLQMHLLHQGHEALNRRTVQTTRCLLPDGDRVVVYCQQYFAFFTLLEHMELTLSMEEDARRRALSKARELRQDILATVSTER